MPSSCQPHVPQDLYDFLHGKRQQHSQDSIERRRASVALAKRSHDHTLELQSRLVRFMSANKNTAKPVGGARRLGDKRQVILTTIIELQ
jgi:hypothetical protein